MREIPPIVKNLIIINVILAISQHVLYSSYGIDIQVYLGLHYFRSELFRPWQLITHMFMHGDPRSINETIIHLLSNMFGLWMLGSILEMKWGPKRFLIFYIICGIGAALCQLGVSALQYEPIVHAYQNYLINTNLDQFISFLQHHLVRGANPFYINRLKENFDLWNADPGNTLYAKLSQQRLHDYIFGANAIGGIHVNGLVDEGMVGASGAIMGILFAFGYLFPNLELMLLFLPIPIKAKWFVSIYALFELYSGIRNSAGDNVAHFAHIGGMLFAFILLKIWHYRFGDRNF